MGTRQAGDSFSEAFGTLAGLAGDYRNLQKETASNDAITKALGITDPNVLAQAAANGGLFNPQDMTAEAMDFFQNRRTTLLGDQNTQASTAGTRARTAKTLADTAWDAQRRPVEAAREDALWYDSRIDREFTLDQRKLGVERDDVNWYDSRIDRQFELDQRERDAGRADVSWNDNRIDREFALDQRERGIAAQNKADATAALQSEARRVANTVADGSLNLEEAKGHIIRMGLAPDAEQFALAELDKVDPAQWAISDTTRREVAAKPVFNQLGESLDSRRAEMNIAFGADADTRLWATSIDRFEGSSNPILDVIEGQFSGKAESPELNESRNSIVSAYERLNKQFDLPPEVIAGVVEESLTDGGWFSDGKLEVDERAAAQRLAAMSTPKKRNRLESARQAYLREDRNIGDIESKYERLLEQAAKATRDGKPEKAREFEEDAKELFDDFVKYRRAAPVDGLMIEKESRKDEVSQADAAFQAAAQQAAQNPNQSLALPMGPTADGVANTSTARGVDYTQSIAANPGNRGINFWDRFMSELRGGSAYD
jgi:hypothetical protein